MKLFLKKAPLVFFLFYNNFNISLNNLEYKQDNYNKITLDEASKIILDYKKTILRKINKNIFIRKGKFGDYIFLKEPSMKHKIFSLNKFKYNYLTCKKSLIIDFIKES